MSNPLIINARRFLPSLMKQNPWPLSRFSAIVFHEILHTHLPPLYAGKSLLLAKYKDETPVVRNHLYLFSVMKHVYLKLGREQQLSDIVTIDSSSNDPSYARAWEIVNKIDGYELFMKELRGR
jgi:hypothetical protein